MPREMVLAPESPPEYGPWFRKMLRGNAPCPGKCSGKWPMVPANASEDAPGNGPSEPVLVLEDRLLPDVVIRPSACPQGSSPPQIPSPDLVLVFGDPSLPGFLH